MVQEVTGSKVLSVHHRTFYQGRYSHRVAIANSRSGQKSGCYIHGGAVPAGPRALYWHKVLSETKTSEWLFP
jgi:hypothetical protein